MSSLLVYMPFVFLAVLISGIFHIILRVFPLATLASAVVVTIIFQLYARIELGYMDKLWIVAATVQFFLACAISAAVGLIVRYSRGK
jgi:hypothetical protein